MPDSNLRFTKVFVLPSGDRVVFQNLFWDPNGEMLWMNVRLQALSISMATGLSLEEGILRLDTSDLPHVPVSIGSPAFLHGSADALCVGGPSFDAHALPEQITEAFIRNASRPYEWRDGTLRLPEPTLPTPPVDPDPRCPICNEPKSHGHLFPECVI